MKTTILFLTMSLLLAGFAVAQNDGMNMGDNMDSVISQAIDAGQGMMNKVLTGVKYMNPEGMNFSIEQEMGNRFGLRAGNITAELEGLNITSEQVQDRLRLVANLSNGRFAEIKVMPDTASETALQMLRIHVCNVSNNCTIVLKEVGTGNQTKATYEVQVERHARILGIFQAKMQVAADVDAETGQVISVRKPWWSFIATQPEEG